MKYLLVLALISIPFSAGQAQDLADSSKGVTIMSYDSDPLPRAFASDKSCLGLHQVEFFGTGPDNSDWYMAIVGNGKGSYEVALFLTTSNPHRYILLGTNVKNGVRKACDVITGKSKATWMVVP